MPGYNCDSNIYMHYVSFGVVRKMQLKLERDQLIYKIQNNCNWYNGRVHTEACVFLLWYYILVSNFVSTLSHYFARIMYLIFDATSK